MRALSVIVASVSAVSVVAIRTALRAKDDAYSTPSIDPADKLETFTGLTFDPVSKQYSLDFGGSPMAIAKPVDTSMQSPYDSAGANYGMNQVEFVEPDKSQTSTLGAYSPTAVVVQPCRPSDDANRSKCVKGTIAANLYMAPPIPASGPPSR
jgi:hypothetical protein